MPALVNAGITPPQGPRADDAMLRHLAADVAARPFAALCTDLILWMSWSLLGAVLIT